VYKYIYNTKKRLLNIKAGTIYTKVTNFAEVYQSIASYESENSCWTFKLVAKMSKLFEAFFIMLEFPT